MSEVTCRLTLNFDLYTLNLFLSNRPGRQRGNDSWCRPFLRGLRVADRRRWRSGGRRRVIELQPRGQTPHLLGIERFPRKQRISHVQQVLLVLADNSLRSFVVVSHEALYFLVDLDRGVLGKSRCCAISRPRKICSSFFQTSEGPERRSFPTHIPCDAQDRSRSRCRFLHRS